jgi:hypothetical protein
MIRIVVAETGKPVNPQVGYVDGYLFADRLLEGVKFKITLDENGEPICDGVDESHRAYCEKFSEMQIQAWAIGALEMIDCMTTKDGQIDLLIEECDDDDDS